jgi:hypothetical protein
LTQVSLFDPTPEAIRVGRKHLYDALDSGLGHVVRLVPRGCAHGPAGVGPGRSPGEVKAFTGQNLAREPTTPLRRLPAPPMKGPMTTQTLQDIIGKEPHHWRGDRDGIEEFNGAFVGAAGRGRSR